MPKSGYLSVMASDVQHRITRLSGTIIFLFIVLIGWQSYWQVYKSDWLLSQRSNRRVARAELNTPRGAIYDRNGVRLAWSEAGKRRYTDGRAVAAVLGYIDPVYGRSGVEGAWDAELAGLAQRFTPDELRRITRGEKPQGKNLVLTLDLRMQQAALKALGDRRGAVVMLDPATGGILAMATSPTYDLNTLSTDYQQLQQRSDGVLRNRATQDRYPPGSTMKVVTASAALMHGIDPNTRYTCQGKTMLGRTKITDYHGESHGSIAMPRALAKSCNYYFASTAVEMGQAAFVETASAFGFGQQWWGDKEKLPDPRMLPLELTRSSLAANPQQRVAAGEFAQWGFGQATVVATPLQMAMVSAGVANDGTVMTPYLVAQLKKDGTDTPLRSFHSAPLGYAMDADHARAVAEMMHGVVTSGTATGARVSGLTVYGKTGTAEQNGGEDHAWFIGFAEWQHDGETRRVAFAVVIERGGTGGAVAVPVARNVLEVWRNAQR